MLYSFLISIANGHFIVIIFTRLALNLIYILKECVLLFYLRYTLYFKLSISLLSFRILNSS